MDLNLLNDHAYTVPVSANFYLITQLIDDEIGSLPGQINLVFCNDEKIQELNKTYRGKDKVTDVLSFIYSEKPTEVDDLLGEIFICVPQTERQASNADWSKKNLERYSSVEMELYKLFVHGLLHLRGYDHEKDEDFRVMKLLEEKIMNRFLSSE